MNFDTYLRMIANPTAVVTRSMISAIVADPISAILIELMVEILNYYEAIEERYSRFRRRLGID